jgi:transcription initiation factor TFIIIB Brf1 subunit/transcription initiation factor TFIIB
MSIKNYPHTDIVCPECKSTEVLYDPFHNITYCEKCGTVIIDNTFSSIPDEIQVTLDKVKLIRSLWRRKRK